MDKFNALPEKEKKAAFEEAAAQKGVLPIIIEKDFWVCWSLKQLTEIEGLGEYLTFKGGTSLSKAYGLIERFSEDIDLTISREAECLNECANPLQKDIGTNEQKRRIEAVQENAEKFVSEIALPKIQASITQKLGNSDQWKTILDENDKQTILFYYPFIFGDGHWDTTAWDEGAWGGEGYIRSLIRLEFGARGDIDPNESKAITPYLAEIFPQLFDDKKVEVQTLSAERTFWEKVTILHALHHNFKGRDRMSRHYYDTYIMWKSEIANRAVEMSGLLEKVVANKNIMFRRAADSYETAKIGSLRLVPTDGQIAELGKDYKAMEEMFMGEVIAFDIIIEGIRQLENELNS